MKTTKSVLSLVLALAMCLGLAVPALAADASGLDGSSAEGFYKQLSAYSGRGLDVLYADLRDLDADGVSEMIVVSSQKPDQNSFSYYAATVDIWQIKNSAAMKVTSAECFASQSCSMGYITRSGKTYVEAGSFVMRQGMFSGTKVFITTGGFIEELREFGSTEPEVKEQYSRTLNGQTSDITQAEYMKYLGAYVGIENLYVNPEDGPGVFGNYSTEDFLTDGGGQSWTAERGNHASYQTVLNRLSAVKIASSGSSASVPTGSYGPFTLTGMDYAGPATITFEAAMVHKTTIKHCPHELYHTDYLKDEAGAWLPPYHCGGEEYNVTQISVRPGSRITVRADASLYPDIEYGTDAIIADPLDRDNRGVYHPDWLQTSVETMSSCVASKEMFYSGNIAYKIWSAPDGTPYLIALGPDAPAAASAPTGFTDVSASDYFAAPVAWAVEKGITNGTGNNKFSPGQNCTNAQILTFLWRAYGEPEPSIRSPFTNSIPDAYRKAAIWAYEKGMVSGSAFDAGSPCTRAMAVKYMWQAAGSPAPARTAAFTDVPAGAAFASAVSWAVEQGVTSGTSSTTFSPNDICTRGQIVTFLHRNLA